MSWCVSCCGKLLIIIIAFVQPRKGWMGLLDVGVQFFGVLLGFGIMAIIAVTESEHDC